MTTEQVIDKVRKLLALATSPNENEATLAMQKAGELLASHGLSMADVTPEEIRSSVTMETIEMGSKQRIMWIDLLAVEISKSFDCYPVTTYGTGWQMNFIGTPADIEMVKYLLKYLSAEIERMSKRYLRENKNYISSPRAAGNAYRRGVVRTVSDRLKVMYRARSEAMTSDCMALVPVKKEMVEKYTRKQFPRLTRPAKSYVRKELDSYHNGVRDGRNININRPIEGGNCAEHTKAIH